MKKLLKNKKGFTLIEMLIVVAIIVILVAISIPTFSANLDNAKKATDDANLRAAKSAAITAAAMGDDDDIDNGWYYNPDSGKFQSAKPTGYGESSSCKGQVIAVTISGDDVTVGWQS